MKNPKPESGSGKIPARRLSRGILATSAAALVGVSFMIGTACAATDAFEGGDATAPTDWNQADNWSDGVPTSTSQVFFLSRVRLAGPTITLTAAAFADTLSFQNVSTITITGSTLTLTTGTISVENNASDTISSALGGTNISVNTPAATINGANLILSGANTYTGTTSLTAGLLIAASNGALSGSGVTVSNGATLALNTGVTTNAIPVSIIGTGVAAGSGQSGALLGGYGGGTSTYAGAVTLAGNATIGAFFGAGAPFNLTGGINTNGSTVTLGLDTGNAGVATVGTMNVNSVISGTGGVVVDSQTINFNASNTHTGTTAIIDGGTLNANVAGALPAPAADGGTATARSAVSMDQSGGGSSTLALGANQAIASLTGATASMVNLNAQQLTIGTAAGSTTFAGVISGTGGSLTKDGASTQILSGANTYTGTTAIIGGGTLNANVAGALPAPAADGGTATARTAVSMDQSGGGNSTLALGANQAIASLTGATTSKVNLNANQLTIGTAAGSTTFAGVISGTGGSLTKDGASTQILSGANSYTGATTVNAGTLQIGDGSTAGTSIASSGTVQVNNAGTLAINLNDSGTTFGNNVSLNATTASVNAIGASFVNVTGVISGSGAFNQNGAGTTILTGANTYTGATTVNAGALQIGDGSTVGTSIASSGIVQVNNAGTLAISLSDGSTFGNNVALHATNASVESAPRQGTTNFITGVISGAGSFNISGGNTVLTGAINTSGTINVGVGSTLTVNGGTISLISIVNVSGVLAGTGGILGPLTLEFPTGIINFNAGAAIAGPLTAFGGHWNGLGTVADVTVSGPFTIGNGANLTTTELVVTADGSLAAGNSASTLTGNLLCMIGSSSTYSGVIAGFGGGVTVDGGGLILSGSNTYTGRTTILDGGLLRANAAGALPAPPSDGGSGFVRSPVVMDATGGGGSALFLGANQAIASLTGAASSKVNLNANTLTIGGPGTTFAGVISGTGGSLTIDGGTQILSGLNTYTGRTNTTGGTLVVNGSIAASSGVTVESGAKLSGHGSVSTISGAGTVAPGDPEILTAPQVDPSGGLGFAFSFTQPGSPTYGNVSASGNDLLHLTDSTPFVFALTTANTLTLDFSGANLQAGQTYLGGFFTDAPVADSMLNGANFVFTGLNGAVVQYEGLVTAPSAGFATGTVTNGEVMEFQVMPVPEPSTLTMLLGAIGGFAGFLRLGRRSRDPARDESWGTT